MCRLFGYAVVTGLSGLYGANGYKETPAFCGRFFMERMMGVEPTYAAWEAAVLPMNYSRIWKPMIIIADLFPFCNLKISSRMNLPCRT